MRPLFSSPVRQPSSSRLATVRHSEATAMLNYMAATESAKARMCSQSALRQRSMTPERDLRGGATAKKRLSFLEGYCQSFRSLSFKSVSSYAVLERVSSVRVESVGMLELSS
ncbi:hypothetical protein J5N97_026453 [Dioscorea zingiberensis]|uniref:DUF4005 domain-containing protein n=1 Tax=Dioscorea zingiberensis TaxID=325984 RepID=A0A9D5C2F2_9LILI|nr:hypothetical protein J5N97_026453 [Dioscorea zingiberensis]